MSVSILRMSVLMTGCDLYFVKYNSDQEKNKNHEDRI